MSVVVVVCNAEEAAALVRWGLRFARARKERALLVHVHQQRGSAEVMKRVPLVLEAGAADETPVLKNMRQTVVEVRTGLAEAQTETDDGRTQVPTFWWLRHERPIDGLRPWLREIGAGLVVVGTRGDGDGEDPGGQIFERLDCAAVVMRARGSSGVNCPSILVPTAGGRHAQAALSLAAAAAGDQGRVVALFMQHPGGEEPLAVGEQRLRRALRAAKVHGLPQVVPKVVLGTNIRRLIGEEAEGHDLVIVGASEHLLMTRLLFGTVSEHLLARDTGATAVAVLRRSRPVHLRLLRLLDRTALAHVPQIGRQERISLSANLYSGSSANFDYGVLIVLSTAIAAFGLVADSTAVVVGAMLVAPLMTPLVGAGLGLVQGNAWLVRTAAKAIVSGFLMALVVGVLVGLSTGLRVLTPEILSRGQPTLVDLAIAFFSGVAGAYAMARPHLSAALPGVAIAAALVPPIASVGLSLSVGDVANARGAALLFATNVVAIILGSAAAMYLVGLRPTSNRGGLPMWVSRLLQGLLLGTIVLSVPLAWVNLVGWSELRDNLEKELREGLQQREGIVLDRVERRRDGSIAVIVLHPQQLDHETTRWIYQRVQEVYDREVRVQVETRLVSTFDYDSAGRP